jgi:hypothetical protein
MKDQSSKQDDTLVGKSTITTINDQPTRTVMGIYAILATILILILNPNIHHPAYSLTQPTRMPKYTRPGVEAAVRLSQLKEEGIWHAIEAQYPDMLHAKNGKELASLDQQCEELGQLWRNNDRDRGSTCTGGSTDTYCTLEELTTVIQWKFSKGKARPLWKHIRSNTEDGVRDASQKAFSLISSIAMDGDDAVGDGESSSSVEQKQNAILKKAIEEFSTPLKGIGPASATAFLSLYRPDLCIFMDDEVIECLYPGKRGYTIKIYLEINHKCQKLAEELGEGWTTRRAGRALWTAAKLSLCEDTCDLTVGVGGDAGSCVTVGDGDVDAGGEGMMVGGSKKKRLPKQEGNVAVRKARTNKIDGSEKVRDDAEKKIETHPFVSTTARRRSKRRKR